MEHDGNLNLPPDIYRMRRDKSRSGCLAMVVALGISALLAAAVAAWWWHGNRGTDGTEPAEPLELPEAPVEGDLPPAELPLPDAVPGTSPGPESRPLPEPPREEATPPAAQAAPEAPALPPPPPLASLPTDGSGTAADAAAPAQPPSPAPAEEALPAPSGGDADALFAQARDRYAAGDGQAAREAGLDALAARPGDPEIEAFLSKLDLELLVSQRPMPEKTEYTVQSGDFLGKIAATFNTPVLLIAKANGIRGDNIRVGQRLTLLDGRNHTFAVRVSKSRNDLVLTLDGKFFKRYRVSTGTNAGTPAGVFKIVDKIEHPTWFPSGGRSIPYGDPENLLGTHWLALDRPGYGLHGTWDPGSIGSQSSAGCVRLLNEEIEELYTILPKGTVVTIVE
ncbi:MAG: L,D-transpeptidase family protein [Kiritimatiellae bacterium]|nr:L,D-transpeptidase family protein [Kiritimatiellia bacterium]